MCGQQRLGEVNEGQGMAYLGEDQFGWPDARVGDTNPGCGEAQNRRRLPK